MQPHSQTFFAQRLLTSVLLALAVGTALSGALPDENKQSLGVIGANYG